jgi:diguanylate cyclase (GGDEF)-like protein
MNSQRPRRTRLIVPAFLLAVACLAGVSVLSYDNTRALHQAGRRVAHTQEVRAGIEEVSGAMAAAQTAKLRFLLSGDERHLEQFDVDRGEVEVRLDRLEGLVADDPAQHFRLGELRTQVDDALRSARRAIVMRHAGALAPASVDSGSARTMRETAEIDRTIAAMQDHEARLLASRNELADATADRVLLTLGGLSFVTVALLVGAYLAARAEGRRRMQAERETRAANDMLTARVVELEWRTREVTALNEVSEMLQLCLTAAQAYEAMGQFVQRLVRQSSGFVAIIKDSRNVAECVASWGDLQGDSHFAPDECCALRAGRLIDTAPGGAIVRCTHRVAPESAMGRTVCIPLLAHGETFGVLHVYLPMEASPFATSEFSASMSTIGDPVALLARVSEQCAIALANLRLRERLQHQSIRDPLTSAFNRRYLEASLDRELSRASRNGHPVSLLMLDVDHFKQFNDRFGHDAGDTVLRELAGALHRSVRQEDIVCRYGGEEFAVLLPDTPLDAARERAEAICAAIRTIAIDHRGQRIGPVTASIGIASYPTHADHPRELVRTADRALYRAKELGRDRVELAPWLSVHRDGATARA